MGRGGFKRNRGGRRRDAPRTNSFKTYADIVKENEKLQQYYNGLLELNDNEEEREAFWAAFRRELPHSFRFCGSKGHALAVQKLLQTRYIPELAKISHYDGLLVSPPNPVPWYPDNLAWWMTTPKTVIRKFPPFAAFQKFLVSETSVGNISRQEVVSMIPPLLLDVRPGMAVLDLCAAPGSKAAQLLEMIHQGEEARVRKVLRSMEQQLEGKEGEVEVEDGDETDPAAKLSADPSDDGRATGVLIANDSDYKRSQLLIHQLKRLSSPNIIVTNHDATIYPSLRLPPLPSSSGSVRYLKFDRILADVPCSGDGTLRKNVTMWKDWTPASALGLHMVQVRILVRALQMLRPGGRVVYSTCSLNPVENESVVATAIELCGGPDRVAILDSHDQLPLLKRRPGLKKWHIMDKNGRQWNSWAEVEAYVQSEESGGVTPSRVAPSMFPSEASDRLPLERCMRVYPHLQDTGGFFIVALEKKVEFKVRTPAGSNGASAQKTAAPKRPADDENEEASLVKKQKQDVEATAPVEAVEAPAPAPAETVVEAPVETAVEAPVAPAAAEPVAPEAPAAPAEPAEADIAWRPKNSGPYEEPFKYLSADHAVVQEIQAFYKLSSRFPADRFMVRNAFGEPAKGIYYTSQLVRDILVSNTSDMTPQQRQQQRLQQQKDGQPAQTQLLPPPVPQGRVKFVHGGVRMFVKQEAPSAGVCRWRIQSEGMPLLQGYVGEERVVHLNRKETLRALLVEMFPKFADGGWKRLGEVGQRLPEIGMGCFVLKVEPKDDEGETNEGAVENGEGEGEKKPEENIPLEAMALPLWKSFQSLNLMLPKEDRAAMLLRIFNDTTPLVNNALNKKKQQPAEASANDQPAAEKPEKPEATEATEATETAGTAAVEPTTAEDVELNDYDAEDAPSS